MRKTVNILNGVYIPQYESANIIRNAISPNTNSFLPHSLFLKEILKKKDITVFNNKPFTDLIICVKFDSPYFTFDEEGNKKVIYTTDEIRNLFYTKGFIINGEKYVRAYRGAGKARIGECYFIKEERYQKMLDIQLAGLPIKENDVIDLASVEAYRGLVASECIKTFSIDKDSIVIVDDVYGAKTLQKYAVVKEDEDGNLYTTYEDREENCCLTDGYSFGDSSIFEEYLDNHSYALLRNNWFKSACLNCNLQQFFKDNNITYITDMFGKKHNVENIKLIITPNSLKYMKMAHLFPSKIKCFNSWKKHMLEFGVVKFDKQTNSNNLNYQVVNSLPLNYQDCKDLLSNTVEKINRVNNDADYFGEMISGTSGLVGKLLERNSDFQYTNMYKQIRKDYVQSLKNEAYQGRISLGKSHCGYHTIFTNPIEALKLICKLPVNELTLTGKQLWCSKYNDKEKLGAFRSPHISELNCMAMTNTFHKDFKYINYNENICLINAYDIDILSVAEGADCDGDTFCLTNNEVIVKAVNKLKDLPIPFDGVGGIKKEYKFNSKCLAELDNSSHNNLIGIVINKSQLLNSLLNHYKTIGEEKYIKELQDYIVILDILSRICIDSAKKTFTVNTNKIFNRINKADFYLKEDGKRVLPLFFKKILRKDYGYEFRGYETPMDYISQIISEVKKAKRTKTVEFKSLLVKAKTFDNQERNNYQAEKIRGAFKDYNKSCSFAIQSIKNPESKKKFLSRAKLDLINELRLIDTNERTLYTVVKNCTSSQLLILYSVYNEKIINLFKVEEV